MEVAPEYDATSNTAQVGKQMLFEILCLAAHSRQKVKLMNNLKATINGDGILTMVVDTKKRLGASKSGKSTIIGSSNGIYSVAPGIEIGVNVFTPNK